MSDTKLKSCPFCGGELKYNFTLGAVECEICGAMIGFPKLTRHEDKIMAINTRKPMDRIIERLEDKKYPESIAKDSVRERIINNVLTRAIDIVKVGGE